MMEWLPQRGSPDKARSDLHRLSNGHRPKPTTPRGVVDQPFAASPQFTTSPQSQDKAPAERYRHREPTTPAVELQVPSLAGKLTAGSTMGSPRSSIGILEPRSPVSSLPDVSYYQYKTGSSAAGSDAGCDIPGAMNSRLLSDGWALIEQTRNQLEEQEKHMNRKCAQQEKEIERLRKRCKFADQKLADVLGQNPENLGGRSSMPSMGGLDSFEAERLKSSEAKARQECVTAERDAQAVRAELADAKREIQDLQSKLHRMDASVQKQREDEKQERETKATLLCKTDAALEQIDILKQDLENRDKALQQKSQALSAALREADHAKDSKDAYNQRLEITVEDLDRCNHALKEKSQALVSALQDADEAKDSEMRCSKRLESTLVESREDAKRHRQREVLLESEMRECQLKAMQLQKLQNEASLAHKQAVKEATKHSEDTLATRQQLDSTSRRLANALDESRRLEAQLAARTHHETLMNTEIEACRQQLSTFEDSAQWKAKVLAEEFKRRADCERSLKTNQEAMERLQSELLQLQEELARSQEDSKGRLNHAAAELQKSQEEVLGEAQQITQLGAQLKASHQDAERIQKLEGVLEAELNNSRAEVFGGSEQLKLLESRLMTSQQDVERLQKLEVILEAESKRAHAEVIGEAEQIGKLESLLNASQQDAERLQKLESVLQADLQRSHSEVFEDAEQIKHLQSLLKTSQQDAERLQKFEVVQTLKQEVAERDLHFKEVQAMQQQVAEKDQFLKEIHDLKQQVAVKDQNLKEIQSLKHELMMMEKDSQIKAIQVQNHDGLERASHLKEIQALKQEITDKDAHFKDILILKEQMAKNEVMLKDVLLKKMESEDAAEESRLSKELGNLKEELAQKDSLLEHRKVSEEEDARKVSRASQEQAVRLEALENKLREREQANTNALKAQEQAFQEQRKALEEELAAQNEFCSAAQNSFDNLAQMHQARVKEVQQEADELRHRLRGQHDQGRLQEQDALPYSPQSSCRLSHREILPRMTPVANMGHLIAIDFDEVLCPYQANFFRWFAANYPDQEPPDGHVLFDGDNPLRAEYLSSLTAADPGEIYGALENLQRLKVAGHRLVIITSRPTFLRPATEQIVYKQFPGIFEAIYFTDGTSKGVVCNQIGAGIMVDDSVDHAVNVADHDVDVVLFDLDGKYSWSKSFDNCHPKVVRCYSWQSTVDWILKHIAQLNAQGKSNDAVVDSLGVRQRHSEREKTEHVVTPGRVTPRSTEKPPVVQHLPTPSDSTAMHTPTPVELSPSTDRQCSRPDHRPDSETMQRRNQTLVEEVAEQLRKVNAASGTPVTSGLMKPAVIFDPCSRSAVDQTMPILSSVSEGTLPSTALQSDINISNLDSPRTATPVQPCPGPRPQDNRSSKSIVIVDGITPATTRGELRQVFERFGSIISCTLPLIDRRHVEPCMVNFADHSSAREAVAQCTEGNVRLNGKVVVALALKEESEAPTGTAPQHVPRDVTSPMHPASVTGANVEQRSPTQNGPNQGPLPPGPGSGTRRADVAKASQVSSPGASFPTSMEGSSKIATTAAMDLSTSGSLSGHGATLVDSPGRRVVSYSPVDSPRRVATTKVAKSNQLSSPVKKQTPSGLGQPVYLPNMSKAPNHRL